MATMNSVKVCCFRPVIDVKVDINSQLMVGYRFHCNG